ncbi:MAG: HDOD domain-containing protein [Pseudomonadota bacterium]
MNIPARVKKFLSQKSGNFRLRQADFSDNIEKSITPAGIPLDQVVRAVMVKSGRAYLMAVVNAEQEVDILTLNRLFKRKFEMCSAEEVARLFPECDAHALPPLAEPYGLQAIMDKSIDAMEQVFFASGKSGQFIGSSRDDFAGLHQNSWKSYSIGHSGTGSSLDERAVKSMRRQVQTVEDLPAMPGLAHELIRIRNNPYAHASELAAVIEQDPSLSAQLLRYASVYQGEIESVEQVIVRVLGMDAVLDIAFGLSLGRAFNNPKGGPLGLENFWRHSVYCAALTQALCNSMDYSRRPPAGTAYLAGLLHNFGILLLGHLFPAQFESLNKAVEREPQRNILELERESIGVAHTDLGMWLMQSWEMPTEIIEAVSGHHDPARSGDFSTYANLVYISNALLKRHGIGDAVSKDIPQDLCERFGLTEEQLEAALTTVMQGQGELEVMAARMAA